MDSATPNKYFKHFKGNYYKFLYEAKHTETGEELVVYQALYGEGKIWARPKSMFYEEVSKDGYSGPRFIPVSKREIMAAHPQGSQDHFVENLENRPSKE